MQETQVDPWIWEIPWRRKWQPTPVLLPGKSHRQRSLASYSPRGHKSQTWPLATKPPPSPLPPYMLGTALDIWHIRPWGDQSWLKQLQLCWTVMVPLPVHNQPQCESRGWTSRVWWLWGLMMGWSPNPWLSQLYWNGVCKPQMPWGNIPEHSRNSSLGGLEPIKPRWTLEFRLLCPSGREYVCCPPQRARGRKGYK